ncbi:hypothetical protein CH333_04940 [candidate division WOR-3 bacterium JGI_Cruoil_03_44_89]|uniref:Uncharacterized protein n=1 Tax=candidate division WOR-3 bacterium JGI_Cruoil_03_44_89 TaxID=1973748 RepID=A0A235BU69_UNCW3|nr:MAG: hypothetical protein CH333_04940 [candidate division WOR-3 bacterium JGI_Cruoil_03_44_89]
MVIFLIISVAPVFSELPFGMEELMMTSPSNTIIYNNMDNNYVEDVILRIPGLSLKEGRVYFYGRAVWVTKDGMPVEIGDIASQSIERVEFLGEPSITSHGCPRLNLVTQRFRGGVPHSMVQVRTGDTIGFELERAVFGDGGIYISGQIAESSIYEGNIEYALGKWKARGHLSKNPSVELVSDVFELGLSRDYQEAKTHFKLGDIGIGFGANLDSSLSTYISSKLEPLPLFYIIPQVEYHGDSITPKLSAGFIPYYEAMVFGWSTPSDYGGGVRFRGSSITFSSPDRFGLLVQSEPGDGVSIAVRYDNDGFRLFLGVSHPFDAGKINPHLFITNELLESGVKIIDVDISVRMKRYSPPVFNLSWEFWD